MFHGFSPPSIDCLTIDSESGMDYDVHENKVGEMKDIWEKIGQKKKERSIGKEVLFASPFPRVFRNYLELETRPGARAKIWHAP